MNTALILWCIIMNVVDTYSPGILECDGCWFELGAGALFATVWVGGHCAGWASIRSYRDPPSKVLIAAAIENAYAGNYEQRAGTGWDKFRLRLSRLLGKCLRTETAGEEGKTSLVVMEQGHRDVVWKWDWQNKDETITIKGILPGEQLGIQCNSKRVRVFFRCQLSVAILTYVFVVNMVDK
jgi:hypothetical protein